MKRRVLSLTVVIMFLLAVVLISAGFVFSIRMFSYMEYTLLYYDGNGVLLDSVTSAAIYVVVCSSMVVVGIGILVVLLLHMFRKSSRMLREAEALRKKNEAMELLNHQTQSLAHHQRLETLGTLTSSIAHEFNNLLTPIMGYSLMVLEKLPAGEEELYDNLLEVYNASCTAKTLISRLSDLSRKSTDQSFQLASADELIQKALVVAAPAKPDSVEIRLDLNCQDQRLRVNEIQITQLMLNLILNGFQAMEESGGILTVRTSYDENVILIHVADTGKGISEENLSRIFDPFYTTKEAGKGTGLGLAIAAQVVEDHKGSIHVDSKVGSGSVFTVRLPRRDS